jgi:hypothetical protein
MQLNDSTAIQSWKGSERVYTIGPDYGFWWYFTRKSAHYYLSIDCVVYPRGTYSVSCSKRIDEMSICSSSKSVEEAYKLASDVYYDFIQEVSGKNIKPKHTQEV